LRIHVITRDTADEAWAVADRLLAGIDPADIERMQANLRRSESEGQRRMAELHRGGTDSLEIAPNLWGQQLDAQERLEWPGGGGQQYLVEGFAWAGSLDPDVIDATVADARDNAGFAQPDEWNGVTRPTEVEGVATPVLDLWRESMLGVGTDEKVALALELERAALKSDSRIKTVESAEYGDGIGAAAVAAQLNANITIALGHQTFDIVGDFLRCVPVGMGVDLGRRARFAA